MGCLKSKNGIPADAYIQALPLKGCFTDNYFTQQQKQIVKTTWKYLDSDTMGHGIKIFLRIFEHKPEMQDLFPFRGLQGDELLKNPIFKGHAMRFLYAVGNTVNNIDALDVSCVPTLITLGRKHVVIVKFLDKYVDTFIEAIQYVFETELGSELCTPEVSEAWSAVFKFIVFKMMEGYNDRLKEINNENNGVVSGNIASDNVTKMEINTDERTISKTNSDSNGAC